MSWQTSWAPEIDVTPELAAEIIDSQFEELRPAAVRPAGSGMDNAAFVVNGEFVFRFPRRKFAVALIETETAVLPAIAEELPLPVPVPEFAGAPGNRYPWPFCGYRRIAGQSLCSATLDDDERAALAPAFGRFLRALHAIDPDDCADRGLPRDTIGRLEHERRLSLAQGRLREMERTGLVDAAGPYLAYLERVAPAAEEARHASAIVHGDLYARHVLVDDNNRMSGIIDWGDVHYGHPAIDLAAVHELFPADAHAAFRAAYGVVDTRTWELARYRAIYHAALVTAFGAEIGDRALRSAGLTALRYIREQLV